MTQQDETKSIWKNINGSKELFDLYGYYPALHDASVTNFDVNFEKKEIILTFEYYDLINEKPKIGMDDNGLATKITIIWNQVSEVNLKYYGNDIYDIEFQKINNKIKTQFSNSFGISGHILSRNVEVISVELSNRDSIPNITDFLNTINFTFGN